MPARLLVLARCLERGLPVPRWGNLRRTRPFSEVFGFDRGTPIDRYYLEKFLRACSGDIHGDVLEIQVNSYTKRFGRNVARADTIDINPAFDATYTCDLAHSAGIVPSDAYDCFLLPNTLSVMRDVEGCLREALRIIRPGGTILAAGAVLGQGDAGGDYWRLTELGWQQVAARVWPGCAVSTTSFGNCLAATAAIQGLAHEELTPAELDEYDARFPVFVGIRCRKPPFA
jgi:hypothetical protein